MKKGIILFYLFSSIFSYSQSLDTVLTKKLKIGWNLVGFIGQNPESTKEALDSIMPYIEMIKTFDGFYTPDLEDYLNSLDSLLPLDGILIKINKECELKRLVKKSAIIYIDKEIDPIFSAWDKSYDDLINKPNIPEKVSQLENDLGYLTIEKDSDITNEIQTISKTGNLIILSNSGGTITDSVNTYFGGKGIDISNNIISLSKNTFYLGQDTLNGIVFHIYIGNDGIQHGLIVSKTEYNTQWQTVSSITNSNRTWDGYYNTSLITNSPAITSILELGVDWYLPSFDEIQYLFQNKLHVNKALNDGNSELLKYNNQPRYWISMEADQYNAYYFDLSSGNMGQYPKSSNLFVRGIKAF
jgi:hypothetical protein